MRVVIAMDSFKGSLSSIEAGKAVAEGVRRADGAIECVVCPVADGGEGTSAALTEGLHGKRCACGSRVRSARRSRRNTASKATSPYWKWHRQRACRSYPKISGTP